MRALIGPAGAIGFPAHRKIIDELELKRQQRSRPHGTGGTDYSRLLPPTLVITVFTLQFRVQLQRKSSSSNVKGRERESGRWNYVLLVVLGGRELAI